MRMFHQWSLPVLFIFSLSLTAFSRDKSDPKGWFVEAESYFLFEEYKDALPLYQRILRVDPDNYNVIYKVGICYLNDIYQKKKAIEYLQKAVKNVTRDYRKNNYKERQAPLDAYYYLGRAYHINNMLDKAIESYQRFKKLANPNEFDFNVVNANIKACEVAKKMMAHPVYFGLKNAGPIINSRYEETNPVISGDGKTLVFTRKLPFYDAVFLTKKQANGDWSNPINLTPEFGLDGNSYPTGITYNGDEIFVYRSDNYDGNIYSSKRLAKGWSKLVKLNDQINTKYWESHASPSADGKTLYFTSNRPGGYGGLDIYKSKLTRSGDWGPPVNMGPVINSPENDNTPFITNDGRTLFFSSQGHETMGGYDIFVSQLQSNGIWSKPENMGYPVNTTGDDKFYSPIGVSRFGVYSLYDPKTTKGLRDIYFTEVYNDMIPRTFTITGNLNINQAAGADLKNLSVKLINSDTREVTSQTTPNADGSYSLKAIQGNYIVAVEGTNVETVNKTVNIPVTHPDSLVKIPAIALENPGQHAAPAKVIKPVESKIIAKSNFYAVTDSLGVAIHLVLPRKSALTVRATRNDSLIREDHYNLSRRKFTYHYKPIPGENILHFTAVDKDSNIATTQVTVTYYKPPTTKEPVAQEVVTKPSEVGSGVFGIIASGKLGDYMEKLNRRNFNDYSELYNYLLGRSTEEGFTKADVQNMFSVFFTQKDLDQFDHEFRQFADVGDENTEAIKDSSSIPLQYLNNLLKEVNISEDSVELSLVNMLGYENGDSRKLDRTFLDYSSVSNDITGVTNGMTSAEVYRRFVQQDGKKLAKKALYLASTTDNLNYFLQNLLVASQGELHDYLVNLHLGFEGIHTSIDLVKYLFLKADEGAFAAQDLLQALTKAASNKELYLSRFNSLLTNAATGNLKSQLLSLNNRNPELSKYKDLIDYLLAQSPRKNYTRENVYDLLLDLIGTKDVNDFAGKIKSYQVKSINKALADTTLKYFSSPFELVQYLLSVSGNYNFTESDINNLLIRMLLERGLSDVTIHNESSGHNIWKDSRFVSTIVLINILVVILIILFVSRRKKGDKEQV